MFVYEDVVYGLFVSLVNDNIFVSFLDDGWVFIWDIWEFFYGEFFCLVNYLLVFYSVMFNFVEFRLLVIVNLKEGVGFWDICKF